jgi:hypothetical protein
VATASRVPSADETTDPKLSKIFVFQKTPEFVEVYTFVPPKTVATSLLPSADEATENQFATGAPVCVQVWADTHPTLVNQPPSTISIRNGQFKTMRLLISGNNKH